MATGYSTSNPTGIIGFKSVSTLLHIHIAAESAFYRFAKKTTGVTSKDCPKAWDCHDALDRLHLITRTLFERAIDCVIDDRFYRDLELDLDRGLDLALLRAGVEFVFEIPRDAGRARNYIEIGMIADKVIDAIYEEGVKAVKECRKAKNTGKAGKP